LKGGAEVVKVRGMDIEKLITNTSFFKGLSDAHRRELARIAAQVAVKSAAISSMKEKKATACIC